MKFVTPWLKQHALITHQFVMVVVIVNIQDVPVVGNLPIITINAKIVERLIVSIIAEEFLECVNRVM